MEYNLVKSMKSVLSLHTEVEVRRAVAQSRVSYLARMLATANQHAQPDVNLCKVLASERWPC